MVGTQNLNTRPTNCMHGRPFHFNILVFCSTLTRAFPTRCPGTVFSFSVADKYSRLVHMRQNLGGDRRLAISSCWLMYVQVRSTIFVCKYVCIFLYVRMYAGMYVYMYVCKNVCTYVCMPACMHVSLNACMPECMYVSMHVCMYVCMCVCLFAS